MVTTSYDQFNARMAELVPELKSEYGRYPMKREKWVPSSPNEKSPDGKPSFLASPRDPGNTKPLLDDYVWGPGSRGFGYYHLTTKEAYATLEARLQSASAPTCCFGGSKDKSDLKELHIIMYYRAGSPKPDDDIAREHGAKMSGAAFRAPDDFGLWELNLKAIKK